MKRSIWATTLTPLAMLLGLASPVFGQSFPARDFEGVLCVIELEGEAFGQLPDDVEVVQGTFNSASSAPAARARTSGSSAGSRSRTGQRAT